MKRTFIISLLMTLFVVSAFGNHLKAYFSYSTFYSPDKGPYIETYLSIIGSSTVYKLNENQKYQSSIEVTFIFKQGDDVKTFKKYNLLSPEMTDTLAEKVNFIDQQRIPLPNGKYEFEISLKDVNDDVHPFKTTQIVSLEYSDDKIKLSDIELVESISKTTEPSIISKSGFDILPYTSDFYAENFEKIAFYTELYNAEKELGKNEGFLVNFHIESKETGKIVGNYSSFSREQAKPVHVILNSFTIKKLPSGNYYLVIEVKNKQNELIVSKKVFFQRSNPAATPLLISEDYLNSFVAKIKKEELKEYIASLEPLATQVESSFIENQLKNEDEDLMRQFFYNFWLTRNESSPKTEWNKYYEKVETVNKLFSTQIKKGYKTDRGRIFLKHGKPNTRSVFSSEPNAYPYEIWHYYKIGQFSNKKFVFYNPDLVSNDYPLLHSDMPGYFSYPQWKVQLHKRTNQPIDLDTEDQEDHYGTRAKDYYNNPR